MRLSRVVLGLAALGAACGGSSGPTSPSDTGSGTGPAPVVQGQAVSAISGSPEANLSVIIGSYRGVTTDAQGQFNVDGARPGTYNMQVRGGAIVDRDTTITAASTPARVSVIPSAFDLVAFDEMFRTENARLQRWTSQPSLVVVATTMNFRSMSDDTFQASGEQMTDDEVSLLLSHLNEGMALHTGGTWTGFQSVDIERPASGERVLALRTGKIVVGRYTGIQNLANTIGYGRWSVSPDGTVVGGAIFLDRDFDKNDARRRLLRLHELGHALGYQHVKSRTSIMNPAVGPEPTDFDRAGGVIAFQRPPGNHSPDADPAPTTRLTAGGAGRWSDPTVCR
jgi:hypothetical protein